MLLIPVAAVVIARLEPENQEDTDMIILKSVDFACFNYHYGGLETSVNSIGKFLAAFLCFGW